jgi:hypothetical protein
MKLFKSLLLGSAAGLVVVSGASAADLGAKKPSPVEYVKACYNPLWGTTGGFVIPGTQTCLRISGRVRAQYAWSEQFARNSSKIGGRATVLMNMDAITPSEYGNVRAFASIEVTNRWGLDPSGTANRWATGTQAGVLSLSNSASGVPGTIGPAATINNQILVNNSVAAGRTQTVVNVDKAFIQFAGITAGRFGSFFDFGGTPEITGTSFLSSIGSTNGIAYTASLGSGFLATISLEDPTYRRFSVFSGVNPSAGERAVQGVAQGGYHMPEVVAALRVDQAWGSAQLSGVVREIRVSGAAANTALGIPAIGTSSKLGWAVQGGLKINLPMIAPGDAFFLTGAYGEGALSYSTSNQFGSAVGNQGFGGLGFLASADAVIGPLGGVRLAKHYNVTAAFNHFWTPTIRSGFGGSYLSVDYPNTTAGSLVRDYTAYSGFFNTVWSPVRGLDIGAEVAYVNFRIKGVPVANANSGVGTTRSEDQWLARFRIQRDF